ncbi:MAG: cytochrome C [Pseudomonadota bacterium]
MRTFALILACLLALAAWPGLDPATWADGHGRRERKRQRGDLGKHAVPPANDPLYREACGACHFAYQPGLLPAASWQRLMERLPAHFGEQVDPAPAERGHLAGYLAANAAERCGARLAGKILDCLAGAAPERVTQVPYLIRKHSAHDLPADAFSRPGVGSLANCAACHTTAAQGDYDEHNVRIPPR